MKQTQLPTEKATSRRIEDAPTVSPTREPPPAEWWNERARLEGENNELRAQLSQFALTAFQAERDRREIEYYDPRQMIRADLEQAVAVSPKYAEFGEEARNYIISVAIGTGLNPEFEMHAFPYKGKLIIVPDYKALMRRARQNYGHLMFDERQLSPSQMEARGIPKRDIEEGAIAVEVTATNLIDAVLAKMGDQKYVPWKGVAWAAAMVDEEVWKTIQGKKKKVKTGQRIPVDVPHTRDLYFVAWKRAVRAVCYLIGDLGLNMAAFDHAVRQGSEDEFEFDLGQQIEDAAQALIKNGTVEGTEVSPEVIDQKDEPRETPEPEEPEPASEATEATEAESPERPAPELLEQANVPWAEVHADWGDAEWADYFRWLDARGLTKEDVEIALGSPPNEFPGTRGEHHALLRDAQQAKIDEKPIRPYGEKKEEPPKEGQVDMSGKAGNFFVAKVEAQAQAGKKPVVKMYGMEQGVADPLPAIIREMVTTELRNYFPETEALSTEDWTTVYEHDPESGVSVLVYWQREGEDAPVEVTDIQWV